MTGRMFLPFALLCCVVLSMNVIDLWEWRGRHNLPREVAVNRDRIAQLEKANLPTTDTITIEPSNGHLLLIEELYGPDEELLP